MGEAHGSWVEGGLLTHSSALAQPRAAPRGAQPTRNPHNPRSRALSQKGRQGKQGIAPTTRTRSMLPFRLGRMLPLSERTLQVANSRSTPGEVFCIRGGPSSATSSWPPETLCQQCPPNAPFHPRNPPQTHTPACAPPRISVAPSPTRRRAPHQSLQTHTHPQVPVFRTPSKPE